MRFELSYRPRENLRALVRKRVRRFERRAAAATSGPGGDVVQTAPPPSREDAAAFVTVLLAGAAFCLGIAGWRLAGPGGVVLTVIAGTLGGFWLGRRLGRSSDAG